MRETQGKTYAARGRAAAAVNLIALLVVPVLSMLAGAMAIHAAGPRWIVATYDPDYQYVLNSLNIAEGHAPRHTDHPGTTVQVFGAGVLCARHWMIGADGPLSESILADPEGAAAAISMALRLVHAASILALGAAALAYTRSVACAVVAQAASLASFTALVSTWRVSPEPLLMALGSLLAAATLMALARPGTPRARFAAVSGLVMGLCLATKVTSLPLLLLPLWGIRGPRRWALYFGVVALALFAAIAPILAQAPQIVAWLWGLLIHSGRYGTAGDHAVVEPSRYLKDLALLSRAAPIGVGVAGVGLVVLACTRSHGKEGLGSEFGKAWRALGCSAAAITLQFVLVAKHPEARYLLPALSAVAVPICTGWVLMRSLGRRGIVAACMALAVPIGSAVLAVSEFRQWRHRVRILCKGSLAAHETALRTAAERGGVVVYYYGSSSKEYGLWFADRWTGYRHREALARVYGEIWVYDVWKHQFQVNAVPVAPEHVRAKVAEGKLLLQGPGRDLPTDLDFTPIGNGWERVYVARPRDSGGSPSRPSPSPEE